MNGRDRASTLTSKTKTTILGKWVLSSWKLRAWSRCAARDGHQNSIKYACPYTSSYKSQIPPESNPSERLFEDIRDKSKIQHWDSIGNLQHKSNNKMHRPLLILSTNYQTKASIKSNNSWEEVIIFG